jgi:hypothetical protein
MMAISLFDHQIEAIDKLHSGSILCGGVGSGKSRAAIAYYFVKECGGKIKVNGEGEFSEMTKPKDLYIITTAMKRDSLDWVKECADFLISPDRSISLSGVAVIIDSWNNIEKYIDVKDCFFIFDEQRVVGSGVWVKSFIKITKQNKWILLTATPGDTWMDYIPVFIANGFYKNRTEFIRRHVVYNKFSRFPKIESYFDAARLIKLKQAVIVTMEYTRPTVVHHEEVTTAYNKELFDIVFHKRWNPYEDRPIKDIAELCRVMQKVVNSDLSRLTVLDFLLGAHERVIIFYNFNYELDILRKYAEEWGGAYAEWNGHKHELIPKAKKWIYLVQYTAGAEGWNCTSTNAIIFFSQNYSYKATIQAAGRIDRLNTEYTDLYYYHLVSKSPIDLAIKKALKNKRNFNENRFISK